MDLSNAKSELKYPPKVGISWMIAEAVVMLLTAYGLYLILM